MNDETKSSDGLEKLLRRWGAAESAGQGRPAPPVEPPRRRPDVVWTIMRATAVAAAVLMAVGVCLFVAKGLSRARWQGAGSTTSPAQSAESRIAKLQADLAAAQNELRQARDDLREAGTRAAEAQRQHARQLAKLGDEITSLAKIVEAEKSKSAAAAEQSKQLRVALQNVRAEADLAKADGAAQEKALADLRKRLAAAAKELAGLGEAQRQVLAEGRKVQAQLIRARASQVVLLANFERIYQAVAAGGGRGPWRARQSAARAAGLLAKCDQIRSQANSGQTAQLLERLEVVLIRLDLLDPDDGAAVESFATLAASSGLTRQIDQVLAGGDEPPQVQGWLLAARLIIMGADRVG